MLESSEAPSLSEAFKPSLESDRRRRFFRCEWLCASCLAHAGVGCSRRYCWRSRLMYSLPLTKSSSSVSRSLRSRGFEARDTTRRSSSLSIHKGAFPPSVESFCETECTIEEAGTLDGAASKVKTSASSSGTSES